MWETKKTMNVRWEKKKRKKSKRKTVEKERD